MDPAQAFEVLTTIALLQVSINGETFSIGHACERQKAAVLAASGRSGNLSEAKKYYKLLDAIDELAVSIPKRSKPKKASTKKHQRVPITDSHADEVDNQQPLPFHITPIGADAIVPYKPEVTRPTQKKEDSQKAAWPAALNMFTTGFMNLESLAFYPGRLLKLYWWFVRLAVTLMYGLPLVFLTLVLIYLILGLMAVANSPGLIITALFAVLDIFPTYAKYATSAMYDQFLIEINARLPR